MENEKQLFRFHPSLKEKYFWKNVNSKILNTDNPKYYISTRYDVFNALEILEAGSDKPILCIEGLKKFMNKAENKKLFVKYYQEVYHYLPEQMFRIFAIANDENPEFENAQQLAKVCLNHYIANGGDTEFIKYGIYKAKMEFNKKSLKNKVIEFNSFTLFKQIKTLEFKSLYLKSLYDDLFDQVKNIGTLEESLKKYYSYYNENVYKDLVENINKNKIILKNNLKNFDENSLSNFIKTKRNFLKEQNEQFINEINEIELNDFCDDEEYFKKESQIEINEKNLKLCDLFENIVKETNFNDVKVSNSTPISKSTKQIN